MSTPLQPPQSALFVFSDRYAMRVNYHEQRGNLHTPRNLPFLHTAPIELCSVSFTIQEFEAPPFFAFMQSLISWNEDCGYQKLRSCMTGLEELFIFPLTPTQLKDKLKDGWRPGKTGQIVGLNVPMPMLRIKAA